jgi:hypothetical protein
MTQKDLDDLLDYVVPLAQDILGKNGQFYPFGATLSRAGETTLIGEDHGLGEYPEADEALDALYDEARDNAGAIRAVAFASDVLVDGDASAIRVELEHEDGIATVVLVPYTPAEPGGFPRFGPLTSSPGESRVWG